MPYRHGSNHAFMQLNSGFVIFRHMSGSEVDKSLDDYKNTCHSKRLCIPITNETFWWYITGGVKSPDGRSVAKSGRIPEGRTNRCVYHNNTRTESPLYEVCKAILRQGEIDRNSQISISDYRKSYQYNTY